MSENPKQEARMMDVVDGLNETIEAIENIQLGDTNNHEASELYSFREELEEWRKTFRRKEQDARGDADE